MEKKVEENEGKRSKKETTNKKGMERNRRKEKNKQMRCRKQRI